MPRVIHAGGKAAPLRRLPGRFKTRTWGQIEGAWRGEGGMPGLALGRAGCAGTPQAPAQHALLDEVSQGPPSAVSTARVALSLNARTCRLHSLGLLIDTAMPTGTLSRLRQRACLPALTLHTRRLRVMHPPASSSPVSPPTPRGGRLQTCWWAAVQRKGGVGWDGVRWVGAARRSASRIWVGGPCEG